MLDPYRFVICPSYHGATALAFLLNNHPSLSCLGDTLPWTGKNQSCSCGSHVKECEFWQEISRRVGGDAQDGQPQLLPLLPRLLPWTRANRLAARALVGASLLVGRSARLAAPSACRNFVRSYDVFYDAVRELHGTPNVVDGSKSIGKILALRGLGEPRRHAFVLHLTRDPRGYAASLRRRGALPREIGDAGRSWRRTHNLIAATLHERKRLSYLQIRYEDLCEHPQLTIAEVFRFFGVEPADVFQPARDARKNHIIGNRMLKSFDGRLRLDRRWETELSAQEQDTVLKRAGRLAGVYGYR